MTTTKTNTIVWIALIILISLSYFFSETGLKNASIIVSIASIIKFISVSFQFMEAKKANTFWKTMLFLFAIVYLISVFTLY